MSSVKHLVYAVIHFLREQSQMDTFTSDEQESLEVAIQCLETVFKINLEDSHLAVPVRLTEMFADSCHKNEILPLSDSMPEDIEKADQLKDEGNNHMKEENYGAAVDCYNQAIELDPNNAVYYCNRAAAQSKLNNYNEAIKDCERAIAIDPKYSKAYGRMGLEYGPKRITDLLANRPSVTHSADISYETSMLQIHSKESNSDVNASKSNSTAIAAILLSICEISDSP